MRQYILILNNKYKYLKSFTINDVELTNDISEALKMTCKIRVKEALYSCKLKNLECTPEFYRS